MTTNKNILIGVTGSIAAYKSCDIITLLAREGYRIKVMMSPEAAHFITPLTFQTLSGNPVVTDMFSPEGEWDIHHVSLAQWADLLLIAPATAHILSKMTYGFADCIISATVLSAKCPVLCAPAMNERMYTNGILRDNIALLKKRGVIFVGPYKGRLACGTHAIGHIAPVDDITATVRKVCEKKSTAKKTRPHT